MKEKKYELKYELENIYNLAKKLKEAGFPQEDGVYLYENGNGDIGVCSTKYNKKHDLGGYYVPALSEMIEACGDGFENLFKWYSGWICNFDDLYSPDGDSEGDTPEEAVAALWLELNK